MKFKKIRRLAVMALAFCMLMTSVSIPVMAENEHNIEFIIEDITNASDTLALKGESKVMVSVRGDAGILSGIETTVTFRGSLKYSSIQFLAGTSKLPEGYRYCTPAAKANSKSELYASIAAGTKDIEIEADTVLPLFVLTFTGEPGAASEITVDKSSFCVYGGSKSFPDDNVSTTAAASTEERTGVKAGVKLSLDVVKKLGSMTGEYKTTDIFVKLTDVRTGYTIYSDLSNESYRTGGNRYDNGGVPVFLFEKELAAGTYTVELSGAGYVTHSETVAFDTDKTVEYTNADFVPGDVDGNGVINADDKTAYEQLVNAHKYQLSADFNRDGAINSQDNMFAGIDDTAGKDDTTDKDDTTGKDDTAGTDDTPAKDDSSDDDSDGGGGGGGGFGGGGGGGFGGGGGGGAGGAAGGAGAGSGGGIFADLADYGWAQSAIYALKAKGIINGVSATEYAPASNIKRGDFILIITRMLNITTPYTNNFADVAPGTYYYDALARAKAAGIASGDGVNFMPENSITRQDLITLAYRAFLNAGYIKETYNYSVLDQFADKARITDYATAPLASMVAAGIITGDGVNVNSQGFATRAEVAVMCQRLLALIK